MRNARKWIGVGTAACVLGAFAGSVLAQPANDTCETAAALPSGVPTAGTTVGADHSFGVTCQGELGDVWYTFTPPAAGPYVFEVTGESNTSLTLAVLSGCEFPISEMGCVQGGGDGARLELYMWGTFPVTVRVGSWVEQGFTVTAGPLPAPANDECAGALPLTFGVPVNTNNFGATTSFELDNAALCSTTAPGFAGGADVFYSFSPTSDGYYAFNTCGSEFDTILSVHSACPATPGNVLACNDNGPLTGCGQFDGFNAFITGVFLQAGETYYVRVASVLPWDPWSETLGDPVQANFSLAVSEGTAPVVPVNDVCATAAELFPDSITEWTTVHATGGGESACGSEDKFDVWFTFTSPMATDNLYAFTIAPGSFNTAATLTAYDGCGGDVLSCQAYNPLTNPDMTLVVAVGAGETIKLRVAGQGATQDDFAMWVLTQGPAAGNAVCADAEPVSVGVPVAVDTNGAPTGSEIDCGNGVGLGDFYGLWYSFTAPAEGYYRVATDYPAFPDSPRTTLHVLNACDGPAIICSNSGDAQSENELAAAATLLIGANETVYLRVAYDNNQRGMMELTVDGPLPAPPAVANDTCATAQVIGAMPFDATTDITIAGDDGTVCLFDNQQPALAGVWYTFTPASNAWLVASASTSDGSREARVTVFTGSCGSLTQVVCPGFGQTGAPIALTGGTTYYLLASVSEGNGAIGYGTTLSVEFETPVPPSNDHCVSAATVDSSSWQAEVSTLLADADAPQPTCIGQGGVLNNAVWYKITTATAGTLTVHGEGTNFDQYLYSPGGALFGGSCGALTEIACDSPINGWFITREFDITAELAAGQTYYLAVGAWAGANGGDTLVTFEYTGEVAGGCAADFDGDGERAVPDIFAYLSAWFAQDPRADVDGVAGITVPDIFAFLSTWFAGC